MAEITMSFWVLTPFWDKPRGKICRTFAHRSWLNSWCPYCNSWHFVTWGPEMDLCFHGICARCIHVLGLLSIDIWVTVKCLKTNVVLRKHFCQRCARNTVSLYWARIYIYMCVYLFIYLCEKRCSAKSIVFKTICHLSALIVWDRIPRMLQTTTPNKPGRLKTI